MSRFKPFQLVICAALCLLGVGVFSSAAFAVQVQLQQGTATYSQRCCGISTGGDPEQSIDGIFSDIYGVTVNGWAISRSGGGGEYATAETAVWETKSDVYANAITFKMYFLHANPGQLIGRFRWSVTTDDRSNFANGLFADGDVTANWTVLTNPTVSGPSEITFTTLSDDSILAGGAFTGVYPATGIYEVGYSTNLSGITGVRLEALKDASLPAGGPGIFRNGAFALTELEVYITPVPEPETYAMLLAGLGLLGFVARRRKQKAA